MINIKYEKFYGKGMNSIKEDYPELYDCAVSINEAVYNGKILDYKTQKLIAIAITASNSDDRAIKQQMISAINELDVTKDEIMDVLRVVLLTSGMPPFMKSVRILNEVID